MKKVIITMMVAAFATTGFAANLDEGTNELQFRGLIDFDTVADTEINFGLAYGKFIADNMEVGVGGRISDNDIVTDYGIGVFGNIFFPGDSALVPNIGASVSVVGAELDLGGVDEDETALEGSVSAGAAYFLTEDLAIDSRGEFRFASEDIYDEEDGLEDSEFRLTFALRYFFDR